MKCPKCAHRQATVIKCESCGLYFVKFMQHQIRRENRRRAAYRSAAHASGFGLGAIALAAIISAAAVWSMTNRHNPASAISSTTPAAAATNTANFPTAADIKPLAAVARGNTYPAPSELPAADVKPTQRLQ